MKTIPLGKIIDLAKLNKKDLSVILFPELKHPDRSLAAVIAGRLSLNTEQIVKLSEIVGVPVGMLFDDVEWSLSVPSGQAKRVIQMRAYNYFAELDLVTMTTSISKDGLTFIETVQHPPSVELSVYLSSLTELIIKHQ